MAYSPVGSRALARRKPRVPGQHLHLRRPERPGGGNGCQRSVPHRLGQRRAGRWQHRRLRPTFRDAEDPRHRRRRIGGAAHRRAAPAALPVRLPWRRAHDRRRRPRRLHSLQRGLDRNPFAGILLPQPLAEDVRLGSEFQVNGYTANNQTLPSVALAAKGDFVVAWSSVYQDGENTGVFARRFSMTGAALAAEFQVNSSTVSFQAGPSVAADGGGRFVIAWNSFYQDYSSYGVFARRFSSAGAPVASEFQVNSYTTFSQFLPSVAAGASGAFVVAWESEPGRSNNGVFARFLSTSGATLGSEFQVNTYTTGGQRYPSMATDADGDFVVAWESRSGRRGQRHLRAPVLERGHRPRHRAPGQHLHHERPGPRVGGGGCRRRLRRGLAELRPGRLESRCLRSPLLERGHSLSSDFQVNTSTTNIQRAPSVAADAGGRFVIAWQDAGSRRCGFRSLRATRLERGRSSGQRVPGQHQHRG